MKLFYFPIAPNPTKVRVYLAEKGLEIPSQLVSLPAGEQNSPEFRKINPAGALPVLELDDGSALTESLAIIEYLEELHPDPPMWGETPEQRAHARALERRCDLGVLGPLARYIHATKSPLGLPPNPAIADNAMAAARRNLRLLDAEIGDGPFLAGERPTVADCTLRAAFGFADFREVELPERFPNIERWRAFYEARPQANPG